ncbi:hypothetical protein [Lysinibacillus sp. NPDC096212]|uniref:hypothetical protein n=1 Tax=Lysinibacillus sp. NPDC096212 TaxID=3364135 RepID=UPI00382B06A7
MKKLFYIGAMSALLLAACEEAEKPIPENKTIEYPKSSEQKDAEEKALAELEAKEATGDISEKEITVNEVKEIVEYDGMGENDKLISLTIEHGEIKAVIDLAPNKFNLPPKDIAVSKYSQVSDALLEEEGWNTLMIEYVGVGTVSMDISEKESNELGMYYFPVATITEKLK